LRRRPPTRYFGSDGENDEAAMAKKALNLQRAKTQLSRLVDRAAAGEEIVIAKRGRPMARLVPLAPKPRRVAGVLKGKIWEAADCWAPMTEAEAKEWHEGPIEPSA
jgi:prevent-host-death family protein